MTLSETISKFESDFLDPMKARLEQTLIDEVVKRAEIGSKVAFLDVLMFWMKKCEADINLMAVFAEKTALRIDKFKLLEADIHSQQLGVLKDLKEDLEFMRSDLRFNYEKFGKAEGQSDNGSGLYLGF